MLDKTGTQNVPKKTATRLCVPSSALNTRRKGFQMIPLKFVSIAGGW